MLRSLRKVLIQTGPEEGPALDTQSKDRWIRDRGSRDKNAVDMLKERMPLWKKEVYEGGEERVGRGA